jgi:hypothetical protein
LAPAFAIVLNAEGVLGPFVRLGFREYVCPWFDAAPQAPAEAAREDESVRERTDFFASPLSKSEL